MAASFLNLVAAGDMERARTLIGGRAAGLLVKFRDDKMPEEELAELQTLVASRQEVNSRPKGGRHMQFTYSTSEDKMILLEAEHKEGDSSVVKLELRPAPRRRR